jgi:hypothetical protein
MHWQLTPLPRQTALDSYLAKAMQVLCMVWARHHNIPQIARVVTLYFTEAQAPPPRPQRRHLLPS